MKQSRVKASTGSQFNIARLWDRVLIPDYRNHNFLALSYLPGGILLGDPDSGVFGGLGRGRGVSLRSSLGGTSRHSLFQLEAKIACSLIHVATCGQKEKRQPLIMH